MSKVTSGKPEKVHEFIDRLSDEEKECYYYRGADGSSYSDLERKSMVREALHIKKGKKG